MAANFDRKSVFAEHLKRSTDSCGPGPQRTGDNSGSLDDLFGDAPTTQSSNRANKPGRMNVKPW